MTVSEFSFAAEREIGLYETLPDLVLHPDGLRILIVERTAGGSRALQYWIEDGSSRTMFETSHLIDEPTFSPDGEYLAYRVLAVNSSEIEVRSSDGTVFQVTRNSSWNYDLIWTPDSHHLIFVTTRGRRSNLWSVQIP